MTQSVNNIDQKIDELIAKLATVTNGKSRSAYRKPTKILNKVEIKTVKTERDINALNKAISLATREARIAGSYESCIYMLTENAGSHNDKLLAKYQGRYLRFIQRGWLGSAEKIVRKLENEVGWQRLADELGITINSPILDGETKCSVILTNKSENMVVISSIEISCGTADVVQGGFMSTPLQAKSQMKHDVTVRPLSEDPVTFNVLVKYMIDLREKVQKGMFTIEVKK